MDYLINGVLYTPAHAQAPQLVQTSQETDTFDLKENNSTYTQTVGLRKPVDLGTELSAIVGIVNDFPSLQCRQLQYGQYGLQKALEITRIKADLPPEKGGPMSVASLTILQDLTITFKVAGELITSGKIASDNAIVDLNVLKTFLQTISDTHVFCAGISKAEFKSVCSGIRYEPKCLVSRSYPFERYVAKSCLKWFPLRKNASKDEKKAAIVGDIRCSACNKVYRKATSL